MYKNVLVLAYSHKQKIHTGFHFVSKGCLPRCWVLSAVRSAVRECCAECWQPWKYFSSQTLPLQRFERLFLYIPSIPSSVFVFISWSHEAGVSMDGCITRDWILQLYALQSLRDPCIRWWLAQMCRKRVTISHAMQSITRIQESKYSAPRRFLQVFFVFCFCFRQQWIFHTGNLSYLGRQRSYVTCFPSLYSGCRNFEIPQSAPLS